MNYRDFLVWLTTKENLSLTSPKIPLPYVTSNLAEHTTSLRNLARKDVVFELQKPQLDVIENLKTLVTSALCLKIVDSNYQLV